MERAAYDEPLKDVDLLLMPTLPLRATLLPAPDASREDYVARALEMISNTCPFDVTVIRTLWFQQACRQGSLLA